MAEITILEGDCREVIPTLPANSVDLIIADPPYGETRLKWDIWPDGWLNDLPRILKPHGSLWCFGKARTFFKYLSQFSGFKFKQELVWEKHNGATMHADVFRSVHEYLAQFYPAGRKWSEVYKCPVYTKDATARTINKRTKPQHYGQIGDFQYRYENGGKRLLRSVIYHPTEHGAAVHPTQKPVPLLLPIIQYSCPRGGVVLDPFSGSASTGIAARAMGCSAILIENDPDNLAISRKRIAQDMPLFNQCAEAFKEQQR